MNKMHFKGRAEFFSRPSFVPLTFILMNGHARMFVMSKPASDPTVLARPDAAPTRKRRLTAMRLQEIEGNPLTPDEIASRGQA